MGRGLEPERGRLLWRLEPERELERLLWRLEPELVERERTCTGGGRLGLLRERAARACLILYSF